MSNEPYNPNHAQTQDQTNDPVGGEFADYNEFIRHFNNKRTYLNCQREILAAIVFEEGAAELIAHLIAKDFDYRGVFEWQDNPAAFERIAAVTLKHWDKNGKPPSHDIAELMEGDEHALIHIYNLEKLWGKKVGQEELVKKPELFKEDIEWAEAKASFWVERLGRCIGNYIRNNKERNSQYADIEPERQVKQQPESLLSKPQSEPEQQLESQSRGDSIRAMVKQGRTQNEIARELGISRVAVSKHLNPPRKRWNRFGNK